MLGDKRPGTIKKSKEEIEKYPRQVHSDQRHASKLAAIMSKAKAGSVPGPDGVPYNVYKCNHKLPH